MPPGSFTMLKMDRHPPPPAPPRVGAGAKTAQMRFFVCSLLCVVLRGGSDVTLPRRRGLYIVPHEVYGNGPSIVHIPAQ